ncbi:MAG TPA: M15 family metallopeptidase [Nitriliruptorales bacterium]|nr:M15 family metallopeptidase [Nitriliruptorales bacterium]
MGLGRTLTHPPAALQRGIVRSLRGLVALPRAVTGPLARTVVAVPRRLAGAVAATASATRKVPGATARVAVLAVLVPLLVSPIGGAAPERAAEVGGVAIAVAPSPRGLQAVPAGAPAAPQDVAAQQAPAAPRPEIPDTVQSLVPDLIVRPAQGVPQEGLAALTVPGVQHLTGAVEQQVTVAAPAGPAPLRLLVVDPAAFRPLTPESTAQTKAVWERLLDGEMVVRHDVAQQLQLELGGTVPVTGPSGQAVPIRVGAFASNGAPPLADAIVPWEVGGRLGAQAPNLLVIAVTDDTEPSSVGEQVVSALGGGQVTPVQPPQQQRAQLVGAGSAHFEPFSYIDHGDGMISVDPAWVREWIVSAPLPIFGGVARCHKVMLPQLINALLDVQAAGLGHLIDRSDYGGCFVPRHILFDPDRPISMHAWGMAVDFNVRSNQYGAVPTLDHRIVGIFEHWGFRWGGDWTTPDGMHFELRAVIHAH